jgi:tetratricopeptide (TPR) repeat protein
MHGDQRVVAFQPQGGRGRPLGIIEPTNAVILVGQKVEQVAADAGERTSAAALRLEGDNALIAVHRISVLHKLGREDEAIALAARVEAAGEETPRFLRRSAAELIKAKRWAEAEPTAVRLLEIDPNEAQNHALMARCHLHALRPEQALASARRAHELKPDEKFQRLIEQAESAIALRARRARRDAAQEDPADAAV